MFNHDGLYKVTILIILPMPNIKILLVNLNHDSRYSNLIFKLDIYMAHYFQLSSKEFYKLSLETTILPFLVPALPH